MSFWIVVNDRECGPYADVEIYGDTLSVVQHGVWVRFAQFEYSVNEWYPEAAAIEAGLPRDVGVARLQIRAAA